MKGFSTHDPSLGPELTINKVKKVKLEFHPGASRTELNTHHSAAQLTSEKLGHVFISEGK